MFGRRIAMVLIGAAAVAFAAVAPANAADTTVTFTTTTGALSITAQANASLATGSPVPGGSVSGSLGPVTVTDTTGTSAGWRASVYSTTGFTSPTSVTIPVSAVTYTPGDTSGVSAPGTPTITAGSAGSPGSLSTAALTAYTYANATAGGNTVSWTPGLSVSIPLNAATSAAYTATITHQVA